MAHAAFHQQSRTRAPRAFLLGSALLAIGCPSTPELSAAERLTTQPAGWDDALRIAAAVDTDPDPDVVAVTLEARVVPLEIVPGVVTDVWTYNGQLPGPTIRAKRGDRVIVTFTNALPDPTTVHWHGLRVTAEMDGTDLMQEPVLPGGTFTYDLDITDAGTFWYHPHIDSSAQVGYGLYGAFIVTDDAEPALGDELVLVLSDMSLDESGALRPGDHQGWFGDYFGRQGALSLTNGHELPRVKARVGVPQRWRVINASRAKYQRFSLDADDLVLIGGDGGLLERPVKDAVVTLPPGARAEVQFTARGTEDTNIVVMNQGVDIFHVGTPPIGNQMLTVDITAAAAPEPPPLPAVLRALEPLDVDGAPEQEVFLNTALGDDGNTYFAINGQLGHDALALVALKNRTEVWTVRNDTNQDHPFHLHGFFFRILTHNGVAPERDGWLDTINLEPDDEVRLAIPFDDRVGRWMFHCHILDHGDAGMMNAVWLIDG